MAESLAVPEDSLKAGAARRTADLISQAQPVLLVCLGYYAGAWIAKTLRFPDSQPFAHLATHGHPARGTAARAAAKVVDLSTRTCSSPCLGPDARRSVGWRNNKPARRQF